ncbi:unnamed protein product [Lactuca virosa]|uniref:hAT-like transposase RNase-H fold domain-containing protein n=1 Tax=Lactuca virosa TaxID=75947 RepID=A0AAU9NCS5_9ASTR|nr:unnamed protein product [Lactuca virosa]
MDEPINLSGDEVDVSDDEIGDEMEEEVGSAPPISNQNMHKPNLSGNPVKRKRKLTSRVWKAFEILKESDSKGNMLCKCKKCGTTYIAKSSHGTGNLLRHKRACDLIYKSYKDVGQLLIQSNLKGSLGTRSPTFKADEFRELVVVAIATHNLPFQFVEYEGIRKCFAYLYPEVKTFCRNTIKKEIFNTYSIEKSKLCDLLQLVPGRIALTSDCWTSVTTDGHISLTAHFVDHNWCLQKRILAFTSMPPPHNCASLAERVCGLLKQWRIDKKIVSITLDNASANDSMGNALKFDLNLMFDGDYFHVRCCAHILNLIVQDGIRELDGAIIKVRDIVKYYKGSQARKKSILRYVQYVGFESTRGLRQDVPTRWNSTYHMLDSALYHKKTILHLAKTDANYVHCPSFEEWSRIEKICNFLQVFYDVSLAFSGSKYPTSNIYFPNVLKIRLLLQEEKENGDTSIKNMAKNMHLKFDKYWSVSATTKKNESSSHSGVANDKSDTYMTDFDDFFSCEFTTGGKSELQSYLEEPKLPRTGSMHPDIEALCKHTLTMKIGDVNEDESDVPSTPSIQTQHSGLG